MWSVKTLINVIAGNLEVLLRVGISFNILRMAVLNYRFVKMNIRKEARKCSIPPPLLPFATRSLTKLTCSLSLHPFDPLMPGLISSRWPSTAVQKSTVQYNAVQYSIGWCISDITSWFTIRTCPNQFYCLLSNKSKREEEPLNRFQQRKSWNVSQQVTSQTVYRGPITSFNFHVRRKSIYIFYSIIMNHEQTK